MGFGIFGVFWLLVGLLYCFAMRLRGLGFFKKNFSKSF